MRLHLPLLATLTLRATLSAASPAAGSAEVSWSDLERLAGEVARLASERERAADRLRTLSRSAASLLDEIARLKRETPGAGAGRGLTQRLRDFDRVALPLDAEEEKLAQLDRRLGQLRAELERVALAREGELAARARREGVQAVAEDLERLATVRARVATVARAAVEFRPLLVVTAGALDGAPELEAKLAIIDGERARAAARREELRQEERLLAARLSAARQWTRDLGAARREAGGTFEALEQAFERAERSRVALEARMTGISREGQALRDGEAELTARRLEVEERLRVLTRQGPR